jgi:hypothetical protein
LLTWYCSALFKKPILRRTFSITKHFLNKIDLST